mmetsp:Transcript_416/g.616  ORF Transcript_416/g.616 Transcript_416/m.616 type:complete len:210 (-) Transcript_416:1463-2092(-)
MLPPPWESRLLNTAASSSSSCRLLLLLAAALSLESIISLAAVAVLEEAFKAGAYMSGGGCCTVAAADAAAVAMEAVEEEAAAAADCLRKGLLAAALSPGKWRGCWAASGTIPAPNPPKFRTCVLSWLTGPSVRSSMLPAWAAAKAWLSLLSLRYPARLFLPLLLGLLFPFGCCRCCWGAPRRPYCCSCICWLGLGPLSAAAAGLGFGTG